MIVEAVVEAILTGLGIWFGWQLHAFRVEWRALKETMARIGAER